MYTYRFNFAFNYKKTLIDNCSIYDKIIINTIENIMFTTKEEIKNWLKSLYLSDYIIHDDLTVDVNENVDLLMLAIEEDKGFTLDSIPVQFGKVNGFFRCAGLNLTSLKGVPREVNGSFNCSNNKLTSLKYSPIRAKLFNCSYNQLTSLQYCPQEVNLEFDCSHNQLASLEYSPLKTTNFICSHNQLTSLKGVPQELEIFDCGYNKITSLKEGPLVTTVKYVCSYNQLTSFKGITKAVSSLEAKMNQITSLEGLPATLYHLDCSYNQITSLKELPIIKQDLIIRDNPITDYCYKRWNIGKKVNIDYFQEDKIIELSQYYNSKVTDPLKENLNISFSLLAPYLNRLILKEELERDLSTHNIANDKRKI